jgi:hypothetical protein
MLFDAQQHKPSENHFGHHHNSLPNSRALLQSLLRCELLKRGAVDHVSMRVDGVPAAERSAGKRAGDSMERAEPRGVEWAAYRTLAEYESAV